jgi:hypothetical protein
VREPDQKYWDAMIIRAWNNFENCAQLVTAAKYEFGAYPHELGLKRSKNCFGGVRAWVATYMPQLSQKLWDVPKERQVELLHWLQTTDIDIGKADKKTAKYYAEPYNKVSKNKKLMQQRTVSNNLEKTLNAGNSWTKVK